MDDINRFGPELALLIAAGLIIVGDVTLPLRGQARRFMPIAVGLVGVAASDWLVADTDCDGREGRGVRGAAGRR